MAEIRKHNPDAGDGLGKLVRDALGDSIRPMEPGTRDEGGEQQPTKQDPAAPDSRASSLPSWSTDGPTFTF